jgi:hypothetical protein
VCVRVRVRACVCIYIYIYIRSSHSACRKEVMINESVKAKVAPSSTSGRKIG